jgi:N-acyl-phosphatidylethanolamine-hydrolysing phospholipase D
MKTRLIAITILAFILAACSQGIDGEPYFDAAKYHHTAEGFRNPPGSLARDIKPFRFIGFVFRRLTETPEPDMLPPGHVLKPSDAASVPGPNLTWIGHATFLIRLGGLNILTDPFFSERASPFSFVGPKRFAPPGIALTDLPKIDVIVISHNHYDSFDAPALERIASDHPMARVLVPLGLAKPIRALGFTNVREMDWYETDSLGGVKFQTTPAIHRSNRGLFDINQTLWSGFVMSAPGHRIWFAGDTALGPVFKKEIAPRIGPVDTALVPIGAFLPRDFMRPVHVNPEEAVELARIMGAKAAIGMHWGTLPLGADKPRHARQHFEATPAPGINKILMAIGETRSLN